ncbi:MAG: NAD-dependent epimerase/dehydratase family protein [bacterium]|nr:NAD-dependent epimerase/dehydratase family protein [bacterium]
MKKILIFGGTGFVGKYLADKLSKFNVTYFVRKSSDISGIKGDFFYGDLTKKKDTEKACVGQDIIINISGPRKQSGKVDTTVLTTGIKNIVEAAKKSKIEKLIHVSSAAGYRKNKDSYGLGKRKSDEIILKSGINTIILKPTLIFGKEGGIFKKLLKSTTLVPFVVPIIGDGLNKIQPIYVEDVVQAILASIKKENKGITIYDLAGPHPIEYKEFISKILKILKKKKKTLHIPAKLATKLIQKATVKRMLEEINLDIGKTKKELQLKLTSYDKALKKILG